MTEITGDGSVRSDSRYLGKALLGAALLVGLVVLLLPVKYVVNDDPSFAMILSGSDGFPASADVPFLSRILSQTLYSLYAVAPSVPWYGVFLYVSALLGLALFLTIPFAARLSKWTTLILLAGGLPYLLYGLYNISMTNVTLWLELGAVLHLLAWLRSDRSWCASVGLVMAGLVLGYLWRWEMFLVFTAFAVPLLLFSTRVEIRKCLPILIGLCLLVTVDRVWDMSVTTASEHRQYRAFNRVRGRFHDRAEGQYHDGTRAALKKVAWSENDYLAYHDLWMLYDEKAVNESQLNRFLDANQLQQQRGAGGIAGKVEQIIQGNKMVLPPFGLAAVALLLLHLAGWLRCTGRERWRIFVTVGGVAGLAIAVCYVRFVSRVSFPLFMFVLGLIAVVGGTGARDVAKEKASFFCRVAAVVLSLTGIALTATWARVDASALRSESQQRAFIGASLETFLSETGEQPVFIQLDPGVAIMHVGCGPLRERLTDGAVRIVPSGWNMRSPRYRRALAELQVASGQELLARAPDEKSIYFVLYARPWDDVAKVTGTWEAYYQEHFGELASKTYRLEETRHFEADGYRLVFYRITSD